MAAPMASVAPSPTEGEDVPCPAQTWGAARRELLRAVRCGLLCRPKRLARELLLDDEGARLLAGIPTLPEFYPARLERALLEEHAQELEALMGGSGGAPVELVELASAAPPSSMCALLLDALARRQGAVAFWPSSMPAGAPQGAAPSRPRVEVRGTSDELLHGRRADAPTRDGPGAPQGRDPGPRAPGAPRRVLALSAAALGALDAAAAAGLLRTARARCGAHSTLVVGADRSKDLDVILPAYDDARGLHAAASKHLLVRLNRALDVRFDVDTFAHRVRWNSRRVAVELHLESLRSQRVRVEPLSAWVELERGETIETASSATFDDGSLAELLSSSGWRRERTFSDAQGWYSVSICRAA